MSRDIFHQPRVLQAPSNLALNTAREGAATAPLGEFLRFDIVGALSLLDRKPLRSC